MARQNLTVPIGIFAAALVAAATLFTFAHRTRVTVTRAPASDAIARDEDAAKAPQARAESDDEHDGVQAVPKGAQHASNAVDEDVEDAPNEVEQAPTSKRAGRKAARAAGTVAASNAVADPTAAMRTLLSPAATAKSPKPDDVVAAIVALGPQVLPQLVGVVCGDVELPDVAAAAPDGAIDPTVLEQREQIARDAIAAFGADQQLTAIVAHAADADVHRRLTLIQLLGEVEHPDALQAILDMARKIDSIDLQRSYVREPIEVALAAQMATRQATPRKLIAQLQGRDPALLALLGRACVDVASLASGELITALFGRSRELDLELFDALAHARAETRFTLPDEGIDVLRRQLAEPDVEVRRAAIIALGALRDDSALKELIALVAADDPVIADAARWSLRSITGIDRGAEAESWSKWLDEQTTWHEERAPQLIALLQSEKIGDVVDGLSGLLERPCFRRETIAAIEPLLARQEPSVFRAGVSALESMASARAAAALENSLTKVESHRRAFVAAALKRMGEPRGG